MKRSVRAILLVVATSLLIVQVCNAVDVGLSVEVLQELAKQGKAYQSFGDVYYAAAHVLTCPGTDDTVEVCTRKGLAKLYGWMEWQKFREADPAVLAEMVENPVLTVSVYSYGNATDFASDVNVVLIQGDKIIQPSSLENPENLIRSDKPQYLYQKTISAEFTYDSFNPVAITKIAFTKDWARYFYEIDLSKVD